MRSRQLLCWWLAWFLAGVVQAGPQSIEGSWLAQTREQLIAREYWASENESGLQAPNRAQGFRSYFDRFAVRVVSRGAEGTPLAKLSLYAVDRSESDRKAQTHAAGATDLSAQEAEVTQRWPGLEIRFVNRPAGLAQEIVLQQRPSGSGRLTVAINSDAASVEVDAGEFELLGAEGSLRLGSIGAHDGTGLELPVILGVEGAHLLLAVDDQGAQYPITIKTLLSGTADALLQSNQLNAQLGFSVAGGGDVNGDGYADLVVGARFYDNGQISEGAVFVYLGGSGQFNSSADAQLESNQVGAQLGFSVANAGDINGDGYSDVIAGAPFYDSGQSDEGAALVYFGGPGAFNNAVDGLLQADQSDALFGYSVAGAGDVNGDGFADVLVGAPFYSNGQSEEGVARVYFGGAGGFDSTADAQLESDQVGAQLGYSVAGAGDLNGDGFADAVVGAPFLSNGQNEEGGALVYFGAPGTLSTIAAALLESNQPAAQLGISVAGAGDLNGDGFADLIVGAPSYDNGQSNEGVALIYFGGNGPFNSTADALLESDQAQAELGTSVAAAGDVNGDGYADVIVGARGFDSGQDNEGAAFVYFGGVGVFNTTADALLEANQAAALVGCSVAGAGDVNGDGYADVVVGAYQFDNGQTDEGAAFLYLGGAGPFATTPFALLDSNQVEAELGTSVAGAGDLNGDGYSDLIVGAPGFDNGQTDEGAAFVYFGSAGSISSTPAAILESNRAGAQFGFSVAGAGDVNGDGFADLIIGAHLFDGGAAFIYFGGPGAFDSTSDARLDSDQAIAFLGWSVAGAGDVNGDGFTDVLVGAYAYDHGEIDEGAVFLYFGGAGAFDTTADALLESDQANAQLGRSVAGIGDVNGDGYADVAAGASLYDNGQTDEGAVLVYFGGPGAFDPLADAQLESNQIGAQMGLSVAGAGDLNGDGYADLVVGMPKYDNGQSDEGAARVYSGGSGAFDAVPDVQLEANQAAAGMGSSVAGAGDLNGDGYADLIIGAPFYDNGQMLEGVALVYFGGSMAFDSSPDALLESNQFGALLGSSVAGAGDVNGDGYADVVVGAQLYDNGQGNEGAALLYHGNVRGRPVLASQYRGNASAAVQPWGLSEQADGFVIAIQASSPRGRERARLQVESCPEAAPFGSLLCETTAGSWIALGANASGMTLAHSLTGLAVDRLYHWRARVQYAPLTITAPASPTSGPWRRLQANGYVGDIRTNTPPSPLIFGNGFETP